MFKWIFAFLGLIVLNIPGGILGFLLGYGIDEMFASADLPGKSQDKFLNSLAIITAAVMKADGRATKVELDYVKYFFAQTLDSKDSTKTLLLLRDHLKKDKIPVYNACVVLYESISYQERAKIVNYLFGIANSNGVINTSELSIIEYIARNVGLSDSTYYSIKSMYINRSYKQSRKEYDYDYNQNTFTQANNIDWAYSALGIQPSATNDEIKKAYKKLAIKYHPDKQSGEKNKKLAEENFKRINSAFTEIKKERGFN